MNPIENLPVDVESAASPTPPLPANRRAPLVDLLDHWSGESARTAPAKLQTVRLDANSRLLIPFTTSTAPVDLHYVDAPILRSYVHCHGAGCLLCELGKSPEHRQLLPVYDPIAKSVTVLAISPNVRPGALWPQLRPLLTRVKHGERIVLDIRSPGRGEYVVRDMPLLPSSDDGAAVIARFETEYQGGRADPSEVYPRVAREELLAVPEIACEAQFKGIA